MAISDPPSYDVDELREDEEEKQAQHTRPIYGTPNGRLTGLVTVWHRLRHTLDARSTRV